MGNKIFLFILTLLSSCTLNFHSTRPISTHVPSLITDQSVFLKLRGTVWVRNLKGRDEYLFFSELDLKYALVHLRTGEFLRRYPEEYQYIDLSPKVIIFPSLSYKVAEVYQKSEDIDSFIGFRLLAPITLLTVEDSDISDVVDLLESSKGKQWRLYI
ncbi:MAG: hypothetical protein ACRCWI_01465 [Brevinema sp.]